MARTKWTSFIPIHNLEIDKTIGSELRIEKVRFIASSKIPYIRKRLKLHKTFSQYNKSLKSNILGHAPTYAIITANKKSQKDSWTNELKMVKDAVDILRSSQFFPSTRYQKISFGEAYTAVNTVDSYFIAENNMNARASFRNLLVSPPGRYRLDKQWKTSLSNHFFFPLIKILNSKKALVTNGWKEQLRKTAILAGQSQFTESISQAFILNWIALESLLVNSSGKINEALIERLISLFGWLSNQADSEIRGSIEHLYKLRNGLVHSGNIKDITIYDLLELDIILANTLSNLCLMTKTIRSREDLINFSEQIKARKVLGQKIRERPKSLFYISKGTLTKPQKKKYEQLNVWYS